MVWQLECHRARTPGVGRGDVSAARWLRVREVHESDGRESVCALRALGSSDVAWLGPGAQGVVGPRDTAREFILENRMVVCWVAHKLLD